MKKIRTTLGIQSSVDAIFDFIVAFKRAHDGNAPTVREICQAVGLTSQSVVWYHLRKLERQGRIERGHGSRMISVIGGAWTLQAQ